MTGLKAKKPFKGCKRIELKEPISFPCALSFKIDGFRNMCYNGVANSSSGKPFKNLHTMAVFARAGDILKGLDGELCAAEPNDPNLMQKCTSAFNKITGEPDFTLWVFDDFSDLDLEFHQRYINYKRRVEECNDELEEMGLPRFLRAVEYRFIRNQEEYGAMQQEASDLRYEGLYGKRWDGKYKHGRATPVTGECWKDKPWTDEEGEIIDCIEMEENLNEAELDEFGRTKRSSHKENKTGKGHLGSYLVKNPKYDKPFRVSCGSMSMERRRELWEKREEEKGQVVTYKFFDFGIVDVPRSAIYKCHRPEFDLP